MTCSFLFVSALPIFPGRRQPSIFGREMLNFRVRNGNGWDHFLINTDLKEPCSFKTEQKYTCFSKIKILQRVCLNSIGQALDLLVSVS